MTTKRPAKNADALRRGARTGAQAAIGPGGVIALLAVFDLIHWTPEQTAAVMTIALPVWTWLWNRLENRYYRSFIIKR